MTSGGNMVMNSLVVNGQGQTKNPTNAQNRHLRSEARVNMTLLYNVILETKPKIPIASHSVMLSVATNLPRSMCAAFHLI